MMPLSTYIVCYFNNFGILGASKEPNTKTALWEVAWILRQFFSPPIPEFHWRHRFSGVRLADLYFNRPLTVLLYAKV